ncbi:MAG: TAXI family TRAP transporter solute-binding subunit [Bacteroidetes bacterium]|nr:TAXI family TRAP transporter solute-binding subunit [Bacteroidota bacterium]MBT3424184.1 TAXI family TRAP transporter solute-binding subunit [Bacteroidota bacterium]MBT6834935.1 TAXI family TRAP transporter solute-binding subunit [Bacteroidota bacterium]
MMKKRSFSILVILLVLFNFSFAQDDPFAIKKNAGEISVVSGAESGSYYQIAQDIINIYDGKINLVPSKGAVNNYDMLINNPDIDIAFTQYDVLLKAKQYDYQAKTHNTDKIKVLLPLGSEEIHLLVRLDSKIYSISDLKDKKVGVGNPAKEGTYLTSGLIKSIAGINWIDYGKSFDSSFIALIKGDIDALFFVGYAPVNKLKSLLPTYNQLIRLVPIKDERLGQFHKKSIIPAGTYPWLFYNVETYSVNSFLVTNTTNEAPADAEILEKFLLSIRDNHATLKSEGHPMWNEVDLKYNNIQWDIHPVAKKVFKLN